jgi:hypothetical protein
MRIVISTEGRNLSQIPRITLGMTGLACHLAFLPPWREEIWFQEENDKAAGSVKLKLDLVAVDDHW